MKQMLRLLPLLLLTLIYSCSQKKAFDVTEAVSKIFAPDEAQFRRFEIGMSRTEFDAAYTGDAIYGNEMEVIDSLTIADGVYCETAFRFKVDLLSEISVQLVIEDETIKNELWSKLIEKLKADYGNGIEDRGQYYWQVEGVLQTTNIYLTDYSSGPTAGNENKFVIVLYYTAGTSIT